MAGLSTLPLGAMLGACAPTGAKPNLDPIADQVAFVGVEFTLDLRASDPDRDALFYSFTSRIPDIDTRAQIRPFGNGADAQFVWTPLASDVGTWAVDIEVSDGDHTVVETVTIEVKAAEGAGAPIFRKPLGTGTTLDLASKSCLALDVLVEDTDSSSVSITQKEPIIEGATFEQNGPFVGLWTWCPTPAQIEAQDRYALTLAADDGQGPETLKNYLVVLRKAPKPGCAGAAPVVTHAPANQSTTLPILVDAVISDDKGLKNEPLVYWSLTPPASPPDLGAMQQVAMLLLDGTMQNGTWGAEIPNPVAAMSAGASATVYYVIVANDNDDAAGDCDHLTQAPAQGSYSLKVENPGGAGGLGLCEDCTADAQCGGAGDHCVLIGNMGQSFCGKACATDAECPADYYCSVTMLTSVNGVAARQCIPDSYSCSAAPPAAACTDDAYEDNDTRAIADGKPALPPGTYDLQSCPAGSGDDEDWYEITVDTDADVSASISGGASSDLDLALVDAAGNVVAKSENLGASDAVSRCVAPGTYFLRVYTLDSAANPYTLTWSKTATSCAAACTDDALEPDDNGSSATRVNLDDGTYVKDDLQICTGDEDWYRVELFANETIHVTLGFTQTSAAGDLDLQLYKGTTTNLYPCTESDTSGCGPSNGSSTDANENLVKTVSEAGLYYVVVRGWQGAQNQYDLCIGLAATDCPALP